MGLEVGDQIVEVGAEIDQVEEEEVSSVVVEEETQSVLEEAESDQEEEVEAVVDFDCPEAGFFPSQTNCGEYYQCTADKTVIRILKQYFQLRALALFVYVISNFSKVLVEIIMTWSIAFPEG